MNKYFIEFMGVLVILYAKLMTEGDPTVMAIIYFSVFSIGKGITHGYFTPLGVFVSYILGKMTVMESVYYLTAQYLAAAAIIVTFIPLKTFMEHI
jgi:hypothetical protein